MIAALVYPAGALNSRNLHGLNSDLDAVSPELSSICLGNNNRCCGYNSFANQTRVPSPTSTSPIVLFSAGCSGSSIAMNILQDLAEMGNESVLKCRGGWELLNDLSSGFYGDQFRNMTNGIRYFAERAEALHRRMLFKAEKRFALSDAGVMPLLRRLGARIINFRRWNKIDVALCSVRDCFEKYTAFPFGYQVDSSQTPVTDCEFRGRYGNQSNNTNKVFVNLERLVPNLRRLIAVKKETTDWLKVTTVTPSCSRAWRLG
eukprot:TRINITY_DN11176_c0_g1_i1.p1 TRINITY_DN11176_c0_g1~~TRINITY_DN11176_c0_g1_i1.p1  ORF type:complete len:295 (+),score=39.56 TRINITY_DN11176_c0_g1_i1:108-887(+)